MSLNLALGKSFYSPPIFSVTTTTKNCKLREKSVFEELSFVKIENNTSNIDVFHKQIYILQTR